MKTYTLRPNVSLSNIYLYRKPVDFRIGHRGFGAIIEQELAHDPFSGPVCFHQSSRKQNTLQGRAKP